MYNNLTEALLNTRNSETDPLHILYTPWKTRHSATMEDFYTDFLAPRLPAPDVVKRWHELLVAYSQRKDAIFPIRGGNQSGELRRGWLVQVDNGFSYLFASNSLAVYIYKMALDGYCPEEEEFYQFMTEFVKPDQIEWLAEINKSSRKRVVATINNATAGEKERKFPRMPVHFHKIGGTGIDRTEDQKNAYVNAAPAPVCCLWSFGYKHAHLADVAKTFVLGGTTLSYEDVKTALLGQNSDYQWDDTLCNYVWNRKICDYTGDIPFSVIQDYVKAQFFRFLDPLNHFLAPMKEQNKYTNAAGQCLLDIAEYQNLQKYLLQQKQALFATADGSPSCFDDFKKRICAAATLFDCKADAGEEPIDVVYHEKSLGNQKRVEAKLKSATKKSSSGGSRKPKGSSGKATGAANPPIDLDNLTKTYLDSFKVGKIAREVLGAILKSGKISKSDVDKFKTTFPIFGFGWPVLSPTRRNGPYKYYAAPYSLFGESLYMYADWNENHKDRLIQWILQWVAANGSIT